MFIYLLQTIFSFSSELFQYLPSLWISFSITSLLLFELFKLLQDEKHCRTTYNRKSITLNRFHMYSPFNLFSIKQIILLSSIYWDKYPQKSHQQSLQMETLCLQLRFSFPDIFDNSDDVSPLQKTFFISAELNIILKSDGTTFCIMAHDPIISHWINDIIDSNDV